MNTANEILHQLQTLSDPVKQEVLPRFFKTGVGQYGEGDRFLGVTVPSVRQVARSYLQNPHLLTVASQLIQSPWHECRLCALLLLVGRFCKADAREQESIYRFYLSHTERINNWDLVDLSAPQIVGGWLRDKARDDLYRLATGPQLWEGRIAVVSTLTFIRQHDFTDTLRLTEYFLSHTQPRSRRPSSPGQIPPLHDLMQKALGWMLREVGKKETSVLHAFLQQHASTMPRTMLRYAIEKFPPEVRKAYMHQINYV